MQNNLKITSVYVKITIKEVKVAVESVFSCDKWTFNWEIDSDRMDTKEIYMNKNCEFRLLLKILSRVGGLGGNMARTWQASKST